MPETTPQTGAELRAFREAGNVKLDELALVISEDASLLSRWERGLRPIPEDAPARYVDGVRQITGERAEAVGLRIADPEPETVLAEAA